MICSAHRGSPLCYATVCPHLSTLQYKDLLNTSSRRRVIRLRRLQATKLAHAILVDHPWHPPQDRRPKVIVTAVPGTGSIVSRAEQFDRLLQAKAPGRGINFIGRIHPSLTTIATPHYGSPFMDGARYVCASRLCSGTLSTFCIYLFVSGIS